MRKLEKRVYAKHGSYWFVDHARRRQKLSRVEPGEPKMYLALSVRFEVSPASSKPAAIGAFHAEYLPGLAPSM